MASHICKRCQTPFTGGSKRMYCGRACSARISRNKRHGQSFKPEYTAWRDMRGRCSNPNYADYRKYGGRGITVCPQWDESYETFIADMGPFPGKGWSIERINNNGNYEPSNCKWATRLEQARNRSITYTPAQDAVLREMTANGANFTEVAMALGKSKGAIATRAYRIGVKSGLPPRPRKHSLAIPRAQCEEGR